MLAPRKLRVFLCHSSNDKPAVRELYQRLKAEGWIDPWLDEEKLYPGQDWDLEIEKAVEAADAVIVFLSNNSVSKEGYVQRELRFVLRLADFKPEGTVFVIPVRLDDCPMPRRLSMWQYVDYFPEDRKDWAYKRLLGSLKMRAGRLDIPTSSHAVEQARKEKENNKRTVENGYSRKDAENIQEKDRAISTSTPKVFISYSYKDEKYKNELVTMVTPLQDQGILEIWQDRKIEPGDEWYEAIQTAIRECDLALLLISKDFLASRFIRDEELSNLFNHRKNEGLRVVPIIIKHCMWQSVEILKGIQALPTDGKPVVNFKGTNERDRIWTEICKEIENLAKHLLAD